MHAHAPMGLLARLGRWLADFAKMPGRVREMAAAGEQDRDARKVCRSCGTGRVGNLRRETRGGFSATLGQCDACGVWWWINPNTGEIHAPTDPPAHG